MSQRKRYSILLVDDEESTRWGLTRLLNLDGFVTEEAADGRAALEKVMLREYDAIVTDLKMPRMGGLDFIKSIKDRYHGRIIVMTAYGSAETYCQTLDLGAHEYINKPIEYADLRRLLLAILEPGPVTPPEPGGPS